MSNEKKYSSNNFSKGLWKDSIGSMQPQGTYTDAWNAVNETEAANSFGLANEGGNELFVNLPDDADIRGHIYAEERNLHIFFIYYPKQSLSEIGSINENTREYTKILNDNDLNKLSDDEKDKEGMCFSQTEWIDAELKVMEPCSQLYLYWSNNYWYRRINLDNAICDLTYLDLFLFKCPGGPNVKAVRQDTGGFAVVNGIYQFAVQLEDDDHNRTNFFKIGQPVSIADGDFKPGEPSRQSIKLTLDGLSEQYTQANVAVIKTIGGQTTAEVVFQRNYGPGKLHIEYRGQEGEPISLAEILTKDRSWVRGRSLIQKDGHLILYNTLGEINLDYQKEANDIEVEYIVMMVPADEADQVKTLRREEKYLPAIRWNYCDGTSSVDFPISGRAATAYDRELIPADDLNNCTDCDQQRWQVENTAKQTWNQDSLVEAYTASKRSLQAMKYTPPEYKVHEIEDPLPDELKELLSKDIDEMVEDMCNCTTVVDDEENCPCVTHGDLDADCCENLKETMRLFLQGNNQFVEGDDISLSVCSSCGSSCSNKVDCPDGNCPDDGTCPGGTCPNSGCAGSTCGAGTCSNITYTPAPTFYDTLKKIRKTFVEERKKATFSRGYGVEGSEPVDTIDTGVLASQVAAGAPEAGAAKFAKVAIYDEEGCRIVDRQYPIVARGQTGYWETSEMYPMTKDCDDGFLYGDMAGRKVRLLRMPSHAVEPHFISYQNGVINYKDRANEEWQDTYVRMIGLSFQNIQPPKNLPKPLDPQNPFSITYVERTSENKSVVASGLLTHTFKGEIYGRDFAFPKHGVNSLEYFDRNIVRTNDDDEFHGGEQIDALAYNFHSPDTCFARPFLNAEKLKIDFEMYGTGFRHGLYALGDEPDSIFKAQIDQRGTRQSVNLNHYREPVGTTRVIGTEVICCDDVSLRLVQNSCTERADGTFLVKVSWTVTGVDTIFDNIDITATGSGIDGSEQTNSTETSGTYSFIWDDSISGEIGAVDVTYTVFVTTSDGNTCRYTLFGHQLTTDPGDCTESFSGTLTKTDCKEIDITEEGEGHTTRCITGMTYAPADSVVEAPDGISYPLANLWRESSVYLELQKIPELELDGQLQLSNDHSAYNHESAPNGQGDLQKIHLTTCDASFTGDVLDHACPIHKAAGNYVTLLRHIPDQYGSVENQTFIPMGLNGTYSDYLCKGIEGFCGDSFVGFYSMKRTGYVSNKVGNDLTPYFPGSNDGIKIFGIEILSGLLTDLGFGDCSKLPETGVEGDPRNEAGLRSGNCWDGTGNLPPEDNTDPDAYFPRVVKTNVMFWVESDVNLPYRQTGETDLPRTEVVYPELEELEYDWSMNQGVHYDEHYLNRFAEKHERIPQWKIFVRILLHLAGIIVPVILFITSGGLNVSSFADVLGAAARVIMFVAVYLAILKLTSLDNLDKLLGITQCKTDDEGGADEEHLYGFHDNFCQYNYDYSKGNILEVGFSADSSYNVCDCLGDETQRMVYSNKQPIGSPIDAWRNFKINNYLDIPADTGSIQDVFIIGSNMFIHTTDMILNVFSQPGQLEVNDETVLLGRGDLFNKALPIYGGVVEGYAGTEDKNASFTSQWGRVFIDEEARKVFIFNGSNAPEEISNIGVRNFLKENLGLRLMDQFPDFVMRDKRSPVGVGFSVAIDHRHDRLILTKNDYQALEPKKLVLNEDGFTFTTDKGENIFVTDPRYFTNKSFTLSYSFPDKQWISFHSYQPHLYVWNRNNFFSFDETAMWEHNSTESFGSYYGETYPFILEYVSTQDNGDTFELNSVTLDIESYRIEDEEQVHLLKHFADKYIGFNQVQNTGEVDIRLHNELEETSALEGVTEYEGVTAEFVNNRWRLTGFKNRFSAGEEEPMFETFTDKPKKVRENLLTEDIKDFQFFGNQHFNRFIFNTFADKRVIVKVSVTFLEDKIE